MATVTNVYIEKLLKKFFFVKKYKLFYFIYPLQIVNQQTQLVTLETNYTFKKFTNYNLKFLFFINKLKVESKTPYVMFFWFSKYLAYYLKTYTNVLIYWQFININLKSHNTVLLNLWKLTYKKYILQNFFCSAWFYFFLLIQLYFFKNIEHFCLFFSKIIQQFSLKQHKQLFDLVGELFELYLTILSGTKKLKGYRVYFKGKLGRKGSVKKSVVSFSGGLISFTNKSLRYNYKYFLIPTETGVVGCYIGVFYIQMFTYIYLYMFIYFTVYIYLTVYLCLIYKVTNLEQFYLTYLLTVFKKYFNRNPIFFLFFLLTGLPPVSFFFIKFNFLLTSYYNTNFIFQLLIFINILLTMFFYLQIFNTSNTHLKISSKTITMLKKNSIINNNFKFYTGVVYKFYILLVLFFFFNFFFIFFFNDLFLIFFNYFM